MKTPALVVDLDGTLLRSDTLLEQLSWLLAHRPRDLVRVFLDWLRHPSLVALKAHLAAATPDLPVERLPVHDQVLARVRLARASGTRTVLATASHHSIAARIAAHFGAFTDVIATDTHNLKGAAKLHAIRDLLGNEPFTYAGNSAADIPIWREASEAIIVASPRTARRLARRLPQAKVLSPAAPSALTWLRALRVHQWAKNLLVLLPVIAAHQWSDREVVISSLVALVASSLLASSMYLGNDLLDIHADRAQAGNRRRPIAEGEIPLSAAVGVMLGMLGGAFVLAALAPSGRSTVLLAFMAGYVGLNAAYTLVLKRTIMLDVLLLSLLYLWRITLGGAVTGIVLSDWLLAFSVFFFLGLATAKRCIELGQLALYEGATDDRDAREVLGRGYRASDLPVMRGIGLGCGLLSVLVLALYLKDPQTAALYHRPQALWAIVLLTLYWVGRLWVLVARNEVHADPVQFAVRDRTTYLVAATTVAWFVVAI